MTDELELPQPAPRRKKGGAPWDAETARAAGAKGLRKRAENRLARLSGEVSEALAAGVPGDPARALIPRILADEIAFRGELLASVQRLERMLVSALVKQEYDVEKSSLPALIREHRETIKLSLTIIDSARHLDAGKAGAQQVAGLVARFGILREELERRGLIDDRGRPVERRGARVTASASVKETGV